MKKLLGFALLGAVGYYLWKNHFARLFQPKDQVKEVLEEVRLKNEIGNDKRAVFLANQVPVSTIGDTPFAGTPLTAMSSPQIMEAKGLTLLPKGGTSSPNPFDRVVAWLNVLALLLAVQTASAAVPIGYNTNIVGVVPSSVSNLTLWLDAQKMSAISGSQVDTWRGLTGVATNAIAGPFYIPNALNGRPALRFYGTNFLGTTTDLFDVTYDTNFTIFIVQQLTNGSPASQISTSVPGGGFPWYSRFHGTDPRWLSVNLGTSFLSDSSSDSTYPTSARGTNTAHVVCYSYDGRRKIFGVNGYEEIEGAFGNSTMIGVLHIGGLPPATSFWMGEIAEVIVYKDALAATNRLGVMKHLMNKWGIIPAPSVVAFDGNSLTIGTGSTQAMSYPLQVADALGKNVITFNLGAVGQTTSNMQNGASTLLDVMFHPARPDNVLVAWEVTNDLFFSPINSSVAAFNNWVNYCNSRRAVGWKLASLTVLGRTNGPATQEADRLLVNAYMRTNDGRFCDRVIDVAGDNRIGDIGDIVGPYFATDAIHLNNAGYSIVATHVVKALRQMGSTNLFAP